MRFLAIMLAALPMPLMAQTATTATTPPAETMPTTPSATQPTDPTGAATTGGPTTVEGSATAATPAATAPADAASATAALEAQGYSRVAGLTRQADGSWMGRARHGGRTVDVTIAADGTVAKPQ